MQQSELLQKVFADAPDTDREIYLEHIADNHPYFTLAHYYLLKERGGLEKSPFMAAKTALHFSNPFLFQQRLQTDLIYPEPFIQHEKPQEELRIEGHSENIQVETPEELISAGNESKLEKAESDFVVAKQEVKAQIQAGKPEFAAGAHATNGDLLFEPLHTTDYFASQGIKLSETALSEDKLGKQMKSFTDWLKTMKRTPGARENIAVDQKVEIFAENSNREESVITESMAEVYISQQKFGKAREIYEKLSLLNPSKSAYFAAKLDQIKDK